MQNCEPEVPAKTDIAKYIHQRRQFVGGKLSARIAPVEQGPVDAPHFAGLGERGEGRATGDQVKLALSSEPDEFGRTYDFKFYWHFFWELVQKSLART